MFLKSIILILLISQASFASDYAIFEVRKSLPMENNEVAYKDYYINAGNESGLKKGMYLNVIRNSTVMDPAKNITQGSFKIPIAKLQIIHVDKHISIGRLATQMTNDERASVEFEGVMIGDILDMESASMEAPISKAKRKTASADEDSELNVKVKFTQKPQVKLLSPAVVVTPPAPAQTSTNPPSQEMVKLAVPAPQANRETNQSKTIPAEAKKTENIL